MATEPLQELLERAFPDAAELRVEDRTGGGDHFQVTVTSATFNGLPL
ncbi:MAG: BolA family transcriptional regulator, partial [Acidobacteria bacterium]|nr:BolA family transcriptional regulator [Acidobacteriota bacterium]